MEAASLAPIVTAMSVVFGWQPMPDQSENYEYIIQIEPELVATLKAGSSIPITADIPEDIGPIARVRIVVGTGDLPREKLATRHKPLSENQPKKSREGLVETQHVVPPVESDRERYSNQQILPPPGNNSDNRAFARALQQGAQQARSQHDRGTQPQTSNILPPDAGQRLATRIENTAESVESHVRNAGRSVREDVNQLFGNNQSPQENSILRQTENVTPSGGAAPKFGNTQSPTSGSILPPGSNNNNQVQNNQILPKKQRIDQPVASGNASNWQQSPPPNQTANPQQDASLTRSVNSPMGVFDAPWPATTTNTAATTNATTPPAGRLDSSLDDRYGSKQPNNGKSQWPAETQQQQQQVDPFEIASRSGPREARLAGNFNQTNSTKEGPSFPENNGQHDKSRLIAGDDGWGQNASQAPEIRRHMLEDSAEQRTVSATAADGTVNATAAVNKSSGNKTTPEATGSPNTTSLFPLLLSWVLLSGSGAGNLYLFWSYLDIRSKYRGIVQTVGRRGNRD